MELNYRLSASLVLACGIASVLVLSGASAADRVPDFNRQIRPILSNHCFQCHGQDSASRSAELRLDLRSSATELGAIVDGDPSASELIARVTSSDPESRMPPPEVKKPLSKAQIELLRSWIASGAAYSNHWAFERIERPPLPEMPDRWPGKVHNAIDRFIAGRLRTHDLTPSAEANRTTLIRRLYQDLLGLLPTVDAVNAFIQDSSPDAYSRLVEQLLDSPHYGERWGRHWLDQARYADSHGYTIDGPRTMWPYRDWVIKALNDDMPFDQFTIEQLAGDLLPDATKSQLVATAFHRNTMINQEGGVKADQYRHEALVDRVNTTGAVWLGLTVGCAQCHSHKFDPLSHREYYQFYAFFNGAADANNTGPTVEVTEDELFGWSRERAAMQDELRAARRRLQELEPLIAESSMLETVPWNWQAPELASYETEGGTPLQLQEDGSLLAGRDTVKDDSYLVTFGCSTGQLTAVRLRLLTDQRLPRNGPGLATNGNLVLTDAALEVDGEPVRFSAAWADHSQPGYPVLDAIDDRADTGWAINVDDEQRRRGASMNSEHSAVFILPKPISLRDRPVTLVLRHQLHEDYQLGRFAIDFSSIPPETSSGLSDAIAEAADLRTRVSEIQTQLPGGGTGVTQMVINELQSPPDTYRLIRGDFLDPAVDEGRLTPGLPAVLLADETSKTFENRLDLARWLVSRDNPLTARVTVNRVWAKYFGRGLVETDNDFGYQGSPPSHPELLDWLSMEFIESGWSLKQLHRLIVHSATYRQSSEVTAEMLKKDPGNYWLARQSRFRVEAEIVRDQALSAAGLLTGKLGGPSVYPPQPDGVFDFTQRKKNWPTEQGSNRYRRTLYTMVYRSAPYPLLTTFDAPEFSATCTARVRSNTPLQSLTMANDPMFVELALGLARAVIQDAEVGDHEELLVAMFRRCLSRQPRSIELEVLGGFWQRERRRFAQSEESCRQFAGEPSPDVAAWTSLARVLINTDEFLTRN